MKQTVEYNGKQYTFSELAKVAGVCRDTIDKRYKAGLRGEELIKKPHEGKKYELNGEFKTLYEWAKEYGISYKTLYGRIARRVPLEMAVKFKKRMEWRRRAPYKCHGKKKKGMSICNYCQNARADRCVWVLKLKPVKGWVAEKAELDGSYTYNVKECPNYREEEEYAR